MSTPRRYRYVLVSRATIERVKLLVVASAYFGALVALGIVIGWNLAGR